MHKTPHRSDAADLLASGTFALRRALDDLAHRARAADAVGRIPKEASSHSPALEDAARGGRAVAGVVTGDWGLA